MIMVYTNGYKWADRWLEMLDYYQKHFPELYAGALALMATMWELYRNAGSPYGDDEREMLRWQGEQTLKQKKPPC